MWARPACLKAVQAQLLADNASPDTAKLLADRVAAELDPPRSKSDAAAVTNLASTYTQLGDTHHACQYARSALTTARETEATGCLNRLESITTHLTHTTHDPEAKALRHDIITAEHTIAAASAGQRACRP